MRKILCVVILLLILPVCFVLSAEPELSCNGPDAIYAQDSFFLTFHTGGRKITRLEFTLEYDLERMITLGVTQEAGSSWECRLLANRVTLTCPEGSAELPAVEFLVEDVPAGTEVWVSFTDLVMVADGTESHPEDIHWKKTVGQHQSGNNYLAALEISHGALSPAFSPTVEHYTATVSYHVAAVAVTARAGDGYAQVKVSNPELTPGGVTDITVTVTAQDGEKRIYTISVFRQEDPNRPLSSDCYLSGLEVEGFLLSPEFDFRTTEYAVWLPYEISSVKILAQARDSRAEIEVEGNTRLSAGKDNPITVTCTAEDGSQRVYTVIAKRAEPYIPPTTAPETAASSTAVQEAPEPEPVTEDWAEVPVWAYVAIALAAVTGGGAVVMLVSGRKK